MKRGHRRLPLFLACLALTLLAFPTAAQADSGDKPSIHITFENLDGDTLCYGTLLSEERSTGPASAWDGVSEYAHYQYGEEGRAVWEAFVAYEDPDGFYFLQEWWECSETGRLDWTYYPPSTFKILLYFPETGQFAVSGIYERYAFDSFYTVDMANAVPDGEGLFLTAEENYDYAASLFSFACRVVLTILLELVIALLFGFRKKKQFLYIVYVNIATQVLLNLALNIIGYAWGGFTYAICYLLLEIAVFLIEAVLYAVLLRRAGEGKISLLRSTAYALCANGCSFFACLRLSALLPGIFY